MGLASFPWHVQRLTQRPQALQAAGSMSGSREGKGGIIWQTQSGWPRQVQRDSS